MWTAADRREAERSRLHPARPWRRGRPHVWYQMMAGCLMDPIFRVDGQRVVTSPDAAGPWDPRMQHGSAPAALVVWAAEAIPTPVPMQIARVTIDLMRPVPVAPLTIETEILREGRKIQLSRRQAVGGRRGRGQRQRTEDQDANAGVAARGRRSAGRPSRSRAIDGRTRRFRRLPVHKMHLDARRPRSLRHGRSRRDLVSRRPAA